MQKISRAALLRGDWTGKHHVTPLPWSLSRPEFLEACIGCDDCIDVCPESIIEKGPGGYPKLNFSQNSCTFCGECAQVCEHGAFQVPATIQQPSLLQAEIAKDCLAHQNILCSTCGDNCEVEAISFQPAVGTVPQPQVDTNTCTGCGECYRYCPVDAIQISRTLIHQETTETRGLKP
jgi:ferredoxin-type protein NapF